MSFSLSCESRRREGARGGRALQAANLGQAEFIAPAFPAIFDFAR